MSENQNGLMYCSAGLPYWVSNKWVQ